MITLTIVRAKLAGFTYNIRKRICTIALYWQAVEHLRANNLLSPELAQFAATFPQRTDTETGENYCNAAQ